MQVVYPVASQLLSLSKYYFTFAGATPDDAAVAELVVHRVAITMTAPTAPLYDAGEGGTFERGLVAFPMVSTCGNSFRGPGTQEWLRRVKVDTFGVRGPPAVYE